ncbi:SH3 domain-containing protein [Cohaesibacter celericrescens]|uniref:SH3 domain-containing protein n=1 Tax=Cohaesibacter celericrescens TaxID=2067669 RepID=UPI0035661816
MSRLAPSFSLTLFLFAGVIGSPALAQSTNAVAKAFAGQWVSYDHNFSAQASCNLDFSASKQGDLYPIKQSNCIGEMATISGWKIQNNQLLFIGTNKAPIAVVGGNQERLSGTMVTSKRPVIFEKLALAQKIVKARKAIGCSYVGYSKTCASPRQFSPPNIAEGTTAPLKILVNLNTRSEPRNNAKVVSVLKPNTCVSATVCTVASDGLWCKIKTGQTEGWIKKQAVRQKKWPILTFENGC